MLRLVARAAALAGCVFAVAVCGEQGRFTTSSGGGSGSGGSGLTSLNMASDAAGVVSWSPGSLSAPGTFTPTFAQASASQFGVVEVDNSTVVASGGVISVKSGVYDASGAGATAAQELQEAGVQVTTANAVGNQVLAQTQLENTRLRNRLESEAAERARLEAEIAQREAAAQQQAHGEHTDFDQHIARG